MKIHDYDGEIRVCASCGQPCYYGELGTTDGKGWLHFSDQWDGVFCPRFPLAGRALPMQWDQMSLEQVKAVYPNTYPV